MRMQNQTRWITTLSFFLLQLSLIIYLLCEGQRDYAWSTVVSSGGWLLYTLLERFLQIRMPAAVRSLMMLSILFDSLFGYGFRLYETSANFDKVLHIYGTYAFALFFYILAMHLQPGPLSRPLKFLLTLGIGLTLGTFYEILEFAGDTFSHPPLPNQPSLLDTDLDLICDFTGALIAGFQASRQRFVNRNF